mgnify:FL=1
MKGQNLAKPGVPESFRVLVKELQGLGLDVEVKYSDGTIGELLMDEDEEDFSSFRYPSARSRGSDQAPEREKAEVLEEESEVDMLVTEQILFGEDLPEGMSIEEGEEN